MLHRMRRSGVGKKSEKIRGPEHQSQRVDEQILFVLNIVEMIMVSIGMAVMIVPIGFYSLTLVERLSLFQAR